MTLLDDVRSRGAVFVRPTPALLPYVSGYHVYAAGGAPGLPAIDWFFPGWANVRFSVHAGPWQVQFGPAPAQGVPVASLFGPSSRAIRSEAQGGFLFGAGLTPLGYASLFDQPAQTVADRAVPLEDHWPGALRLMRELERAEHLSDVGQILDDALTRRLRPLSPAAQSRIGAIHTLLVNDHGISVDETAFRLGLPVRTLNRATTAAFGFSPKLLLRRSRFLKSLMAMIATPDLPACDVIDAAYFDQSHFIRDSNHFLGMAPNAFIERLTPLMRQSLANRAQALGGPVQGLHTEKSAA